MQLEHTRILETERKLAGLEHSVATYSPEDEDDASFARMRLKWMQDEIGTLREDLTRLETEDIRRTVRQRESSRALRQTGKKLYMGIMAAAAIVAMLAIGLVLSGLIDTPAALAKFNETSHLVASVLPQA